MPVLIRIALRNLLEHKSKSLIIGTIIVLGVIIIVVGNSLMDTAALGVKKSFTASYTGDVFISGIAKGSISIFGAQGMGEAEATPLIPNYDKVRAKFATDKRVAGITSQVSGFGLIAPGGSEVDMSNMEGEGAAAGMTLLFGIEAASYPKLFPGTRITEGRYLEPGEEGILVNKKRLEDMNKRLEKEAEDVTKASPPGSPKIEPKTIKVGDRILVNGFGGRGFKIREVSLVGSFEFDTQSEGLDMISYIDVNSLRALSGLTLGTDEVIELAPEDTELLNADSLEALFGGEEETIMASISAKKPAREEAISAPPKRAEVDEGAWQFTLLRLKNPDSAKPFIAEANRWFAYNGIQARAGDWKAAAGPYAQSIDVIRIIFNAAIIIVAIVAVIIIMNTLVISVIERTGEIGTMRALGAQKPFVWKMFLTETLTVTVVFGIIGIILSFMTIGIVNLLQIKATNSFLEILFAGKVLKAAINPLSLLSTLVMVAIVGLLSHLYPVSIALKISPVKAMQNE